MKVNQPYANTYSRSVKIDPFADADKPSIRDLISVYQQSSVGTSTLEQPQVSWASIGTVSEAEADQFADAIKYGAAIARLWNADTGHRTPWPEMEAVLPAPEPQAGQ